MGESWTEDDSEIYKRLVDVAVPRRTEQLATLLTLLPMGRREPSRVVELGCGTGALSFAILDAFENCTVTALDCFWLQAGHAIYGGYRDLKRRQAPLAYSRALESARRAVSRMSP